MKNALLITTLMVFTGCGGAAGVSNSNTANTNAATTKTDVPVKTSEPFAMHSAPKLIELAKKFKETINADLGGKDLIVIGRAWDVASDGVYLNSSGENVSCIMSSEARADKKFADVQAAKSKSPIVEVRGTFKSASFPSTAETWVTLENCTILSLPNSSGP